MIRAFAGLALFFIAVPSTASELPSYAFDATQIDELADTMPELASRLVEDYADSDRDTYLVNRFRLQLVANRHEDAIASLNELRALRKAAGNENADTTYIQYEIFSRARHRQATDDAAFESAFRDAFRDTFASLDDMPAYKVAERLVYRLDIARNQLQDILEERADPGRLTHDEALRLVQAYQPYLVYERILPLVPDLLAEDDKRRYEVAEDVLIKAGNGVTLSAMVVRPKQFTTPQPVAFVFNIYSDPAADLWLAKLSAAHGYIGVVADARGKRLSPNDITPYEHEVADTHAVLDWIVKQSWSNGEVAMFGGSYQGFAAWAAAKSPHPALKAIAPAAAAIPGLGLPMHNNVFLNANYCWAFHVTNNKTMDHEVCQDQARWERMENQWYASGRPYREIDDIDGTPNPLLQRWLDHPAYDEYWQRMVPHGEEFADIDIPVLTFTGFYDDGQVSALHYLNEHYRYHDNPEHYLVIGPYDHRGSQWGSSPFLRGYRIDPSARINPPQIIFQWFDHVLRDGPKPDLLKDRINYQAMGTNEWRHVSSMKDVGNDTLRLHLSDIGPDGQYSLSTTRPAEPGAVRQETDYSDRESTSFNYYPAPIIRDELEPGNALVFVSEPFERATEISGIFTGELNVTINKKDMDVVLVLYEQMPDGRYFHLSYYLGRASHAKDMTERNLLEPGDMETLPIKRSYMTARRIEKGSRLVAILDINKGPWAQVNYGTGKDVSDESIEDADKPLVVEWHNDSYLEVGISH